MKWRGFNIVKDGLRSSGNELTNQMWLMYVTFEDFICLTYPEKSEEILSSHVNINTYFNTRKSHKSSKQTSDNTGKATEETCERDNKELNKNDEHHLPSELERQTSVAISSHRFARKRRLETLSTDNTPFDREIVHVRGVRISLNNVGSDCFDMPYRDKQTMHNRKKKDHRSNLTLTKDYGFGNSWRIRQSGDIIRNCHLNDQLVNPKASEQNPRTKNPLNNTGCQRDNPQLKLQNKSFNDPADQCVGLSPRNAYPRDVSCNNHLNLSCSATNTPLSLDLTRELNWNNNILNVSAFNPGDSKSARFRLKLDLRNKTSPRSPRRAASKEDIISSHDTSAQELPRSASFDNVLTPEQEMPSKALSCESSPVTISSGYESDSLPTHEADIDNIFVQGKKRQQNKIVPPMELPIDYFSMSDSHPSPHGQKPTCSSAIVTRKPETSVKTELTERSNSNESILREIRPPVQSPMEFVDNQAQPARFSPAQINNYQLTKVARSMFEIIHDLQTEKEQENKAKARKPKRLVQWRKDRTDVGRKFNNNSENKNTLNTSASQRENWEQLQQATNPVHLSAQGKVSVKCLRRPLGSDPNRHILPHSSEFDKPTYLKDEYPEMGVLSSSDKYPEFSRQFSEPELGHSTHSDNFHINHSFDSRDTRHQIVFDGCAPYATTKLPGCSPYATTRLPGCQTPRRDDKDDHVYETIPGDDLLQYEEILRMRLNGLLPHKYLPPALPARNITDRKLSEPARNFHMHPNFVPSQTVGQSYFKNPNHKTTSCDNRQTVNNPRSYSYDPTNVTKGVPNERFCRWSAAELLNYIDDIRQPPPKRRENFYHLLDSKQKRACFSESLEIEHKIKNMGITFEERERLRYAEDGYTTMDSELDIPPPFCGGLQNMQSTYV